MMQRRSFLSLATVALLAAGCGPQVISPAPTLTVDATFLSASLSDDCPTAAAEAPRRGTGAADCAGTGFACGICRQSNMQIRFVASAGEAPAHVDVVSVRVVDAASGEGLDTLTAREPQAWDAASSTYRAWDANVAPSSTVQASWKLSAPRWELIGTSTGRLAYTRRLRLEVVLRVDGVARTLRSGEITREPEVVT